MAIGRLKINLSFGIYSSHITLNCFNLDIFLAALLFKIIDNSVNRCIVTTHVLYKDIICLYTELSLILVDNGHLSGVIRSCIACLLK